jgi:protein-tyrosine phosphatase
MPHISRRAAGAIDPWACWEEYVASSVKRAWGAVPTMTPAELAAPRFDDNPGPEARKGADILARVVAPMVDLHTHVLPGVDDGSPDLETSLAMLRTAGADGIGTVVATPHLREDFLMSGESIEPAVRALQQAADEESIGVRLVAGAEIATTMLLDLDEDAIRGLCIGDGPYVLVETPYAAFPPHFPDSVIDLKARGFEPVLAHPERCTTFLRDRERLAEVVGEGVLCSITAGSMEGRFGRPARELAAWLFERGLVANVASDAHDPLRRSPRLRRGFVLLDDMLPGLLDQAEWYTALAPAAMVAGAELPPRPEPPKARRGLLRRLRRG